MYHPNYQRGQNTVYKIQHQQQNSNAANNNPNWELFPDQVNCTNPQQTSYFCAHEANNIQGTNCVYDSNISRFSHFTQSGQTSNYQVPEPAHNYTVHGQNLQQNYAIQNNRDGKLTTEIPKTKEADSTQINFDGSLEPQSSYNQQLHQDHLNTTVTHNYQQKTNVPATSKTSVEVLKVLDLKNGNTILLNDEVLNKLEIKQLNEMLKNVR